MNEEHESPSSDEFTADQCGKMFLHCRLCLEEITSGVAGTMSPRDYARLSVAWTIQGLQVWCTRHDCNVVHINFEGKRHPAITGRRMHG